MTAQPETPPEQRDESAQAIADRMAPFVTAEGFGPEWALSGPEIVKAYIETAVEEARKRLDAAFAELSREQGKEGFVTVHNSLTTGRTMTTDAPVEQGESRIILDGSCERDKLAAYRSFCHLLGRLEQQMLACANEITIATAPLDQSSWVLSNTAHPDGRCAGLRIIIILPPPAFENDHYADVHKVTHLAVPKAWLAAGKSTLVWLSGLHYSEIRDLAKEIENPRGSLQVVPTGPPKLLAAIHPDGIAGAFRRARHVVFSPAWKPGEAPTIYSRPFHTRIAETLTMLLSVSGNVSIKEAYGPVEVDPGFGATIFTKGKAAEYWHAVMDTWRRGDRKPYYLPVTLDDYSELAKGALPYRVADWLYSSARIDEAGGGHAR